MTPTLLKELGFDTNIGEKSFVFDISESMKNDNVAVLILTEWDEDFSTCTMECEYIVKYEDDLTGKEIFMSKDVSLTDDLWDINKAKQVYVDETRKITIVTDIDFLRKEYSEITERLTFKSPAKSAMKS